VEGESDFEELLVQKQNEIKDSAGSCNAPSQQVTGLDGVANLRVEVVLGSQ
jgi:hypothetical protein